MIQIVQLLCDGMRAFRTVDTDSGILVGLEEIQVVVYRVVMAAGNLRGHEAGQYLLGPYVLKPFQRYEVAKPQVGSLMGYQFHTCQLVLLGSVLLEEHAAVAQLDGTRVLHAAELVVGQDHQTVLLEGTCDTRVAFHPFYRLSHFVEHLVELCHLVGISLPIKGADGLALTAAGLLVEVSGNEGIEVGRQLTDIVAGHRLPAVGHIECGHEDGSEIRLVEAGEHRACQVGHEDGIHIVFVAVQGLVETRETQLDLVLSLL